MSAGGYPSIARLASEWQLDPGLLASAAVVLGLYAWGVTRVGRGHARWPAYRSACFALGVAFVLVALCSGLDGWAERLLSIHMVQHLVLTLVAAPLLVAGAPLALTLRALPQGGARRVAHTLRSPAARALTHPLTTWSLLPALMLATHLTGLYELTLSHPALHAAEHLAFLAAALLFWLPVLGAEPLPRRPGPVGQLLYLLLGMPAMAAAGVVLTIDTSVRYPSYLAPARALRIDALTDQHAAGAIMWVPGSVLAAALTVLAAWIALEREERRALAREARQPLALVLVAIGTAAAGIGALPALAPPARAAGPTASIAPPAQLALGRLLYQGSCSSCHGLAGRGVANRGPSLIGAGAQAADFYLSTGRMPLANPADPPVRSHPLYTRPQIRALTAYVAALAGGPGIPRPDPASASLADGRRAFTDHCAGCHQVVARGGIVTGGIAPPLQQATPTEVAEAVRIGPYLMPRFTRRQIDDRTLNDIVRYVEWTKAPADRGGWSIGNIGPIPEGMVAWMIGLVALLIVIRLIGERSPE